MSFKVMENQHTSKFQGSEIDGSSVGSGGCTMLEPSESAVRGVLGRLVNDGSLNNVLRDPLGSTDAKVEVGGDTVTRLGA